MGERVVRIAAVPAAHPYVQAVRPPGHVLLPDPPVPGAPAGQWWPPVLLRPDALRERAAGFDVLHLHFGAEGAGLDQLEDAVAVLREAGRPLVHTVHDLDHPHLDDQTHHAAQLGLLVAAADGLLTLTDATADETERRFGRRPLVVPHPQLAPDDAAHRADAARRDRPPGGPRVGVHVRSLRANVRPARWLAALATAVEDRGGTTTVVVNDDVRPGGAAHAALEGLRAAVEGTPARVVVRPRPGDDALVEELVGLDVSVLPYAHGTHSGWLELCWDLGVGVLTPDVGALGDQHDEPWAVQTFDPGRSGDVALALDRLLGAGAPAPAAERLAARRTTRRRNHETHAAVYAGLLDRAPRGAPA